MRAWRSAIRVSIVLALAGPASAQAPAPSAADGASSAPSVPRRPSAEQPAGVSKQISGTVQTVEGDKVTLADGTELTIPVSVILQQSALQPGAAVKASYEDRSGEKVVISLEREPGK